MHQKMVFRSILGGTVTFISLWSTGNIDRIFAHILETCGFIFNKLGIQEFLVILFSISKSEI